MKTFFGIEKLHADEIVIDFEKLIVCLKKFVKIYQAGDLERTKS